MRTWMIALCCVSALGAAGCVPEWEEAPLTPTGAAGDNSSAGSSAGKAVPCSGSYAGAITAGMNLDIQPPCTVGDVVLEEVPQETSNVYTVLRGIKTVTGRLTLRPGVSIDTYMPALTSVGTLEVTGTNGNTPKFHIPARIKSLGSLVVNNTDISELTGGDGITAMTGSIDIGQNSNLTSISALNKLATAEDIRLNQANALTKLDAFKALKSAKSLLFSNLGSMTTLPAIAVETVSDAIDIRYCGALTKIDGFAKVSKLNRLNISYNGALTSVSFPALTEVNFLTLAYNDALPTIPFTTLQVKNTYQICVKLMDCADWTKWTADYAASATYSKCQPVSEQCAGL